MNKIFRIGRRVVNLLYYVISTHKRKSLKIIDIQQTAKDIIQNRKSISRYGDGEFDIIFNYLGYSKAMCGFQVYSPKLAQRLIDILKSEPVEGLLIGLPGSIGSGGVMKFRWEDLRYWQNYLRLHLKHLYKIIPSDRVYGDANFTRFYLPMRDKSRVPEYVEELKKIWADRDLLIVEGVMTRLGVSNDLLYGARSIKRILAPAKDAFSKYDEILGTALSHLKELGPDTLVLASLGATATVLTYDLAKAGYQAIDTGHVDLEYEWMRLGVKEKVKVEGKFVNEVAGEDHEAQFDDSEYKKSIIARIE